MNRWDEFKSAAVGKEVHVTRRDYDWVFNFGPRCTLSVETLWRLRDSGGVKLTSYDDGHQFGLPAPLDVEKEVNDRLTGSSVLAIEDADVMPDFTIRFSDGLALEVIARSAGYESWSATFDGNTVVDGRGD